MPIHRRKQKKDIIIYTDTDSVKVEKKKKKYIVKYGLYDYRRGCFIKNEYEKGFKIYGKLETARQWKKIIDRRYKDVISYVCNITEV